MNTNGHMNIATTTTNNNNNFININESNDGTLQNEKLHSAIMS